MRPDLRRLTLLLILAAPPFGIALTSASMLIVGMPFTVAGMVREACAWIAIACSVPAIVAFTERRARVRGGLPRAVAPHIPFFILIVLVHTGTYNGLLALIQGTEGLHWLPQLVTFARYDALLYPLVVLAASMTRQRRLTRRSELAASRLARRVAEAELEHVRVRLDPDEVLADLCEVEALVLHDPDGAERRLHEISRSLRKKLERIATVPPPSLPRRNRRLSPPGDVRRVVFLSSAIFGLYLATIMLILRRMSGGLTLRDLIGTLAAFTAAGAYAAIAIPLFRRAMAWRAHAPAPRLLGAIIATLFCLVPAGLVELLMVVLRRSEMGRPLGSTFDFVMILCVVCLYLVAFDDLKLQQRESRLTAERLAEAVAVARLKSLRTQIAPHFVFNALNSILSLLRQDPVGARQMLRRLRSLLRATTAQRNRQEVTLREDLEMTRSYIEIEKVRFRDAIDVATEVDDTMLDTYVPAFLLQPLVENAIRHGALSTIGRGTVRVTVRGTRDSLTIMVDNDGELLDPAGWRDGIGLSNVRARLAQLYGPRHDLSIHVDEESGVSVRVTLPRRAAVEASLAS